MSSARRRRSRRAVYERAGGVCEVLTTIGRCSDRASTLHHVTPVRSGGTWAQANLIAVCRWHHRWIHQHEDEAVTFGLLR